MRLFIAWACPEELKGTIGDACRPLRDANWPIRWNDPARLHLTLRWLGDLDRRWLTPAADAMDAATRAVGRFEIRIQGLGAFPGLRRPRVIWAGAESQPELHHLHARLDRALVGAGFDGADQEFRPHVTVGRALRTARPHQFSGFDAAARGVRLDATCGVEEVRLIESILEPGGARYRIRARAPLGP